VKTDRKNPIAMHLSAELDQGERFDRVFKALASLTKPNHGLAFILGIASF